MKKRLLVRILALAIAALFVFPAAAASAYTLQDSTVYGGWSESYTYYNCYAYALGRTDGFLWPGSFSIHSSGYSEDQIANISHVAEAVKADLQSSALGYACVDMTTTCPSSVSPGQSCICVRIGPDDYHFMKLSGSAWYHKPGGTNPLKYKYLPSTSRNWTNEASIRGITHKPNTIYDSEIYYFIYKEAHGSLVYTWTGNHYHSGTEEHCYEYGYRCEDCGTFTSTEWITLPCKGPTCVTPWNTQPEPINQKVSIHRNIDTQEKPSSSDGGFFTYPDCKYFRLPGQKPLANDAYVRHNGNIRKY